MSAPIVVPTLEDLAADPSKAALLPPETSRALYVRAVQAMNALLPSALGANETRALEPEPDRLLTLEDAAKVLSVTEAWLYRHSKKLPFTRKLGGRTLRFSERGIQRWQAMRRP